jgi:hypothetical protein
MKKDESQLNVPNAAEQGLSVVSAGKKSNKSRVSAGTSSAALSEGKRRRKLGT